MEVLKLPYRLVVDHRKCWAALLRWRLTPPNAVAALVTGLPVRIASTAAWQLYWVSLVGVGASSKPTVPGFVLQHVCLHIGRCLLMCQTMRA